MMSARTPGSPSLLEAGSRCIVDECCTPSTASTASTEEARDARIADLLTWDVCERKPRSATVGLPKGLWQPDADAPTCSMMTCGKEFNRFFRRHHCRMCGRVVCSDCSTARRRVVPETGTKAHDLRLCDACATPDLYAMSRTVTPSTPPRSRTMSAPTTPSRPNPAKKNVSATSPWGHAAANVSTTSLWGYATTLPRPRSETSLSSPLAIPNSRAVWPPLPDVAMQPRSAASDGGRDGAQGGGKEAAAPPSVACPPGEEEDHVLQAVREKFATTSYYEGLHLHEPAALDLLLRCAADQMRSREM